MKKTTLSVLALVAVMATPAAAYIGPGAGIGAIGTVLAVLGSILLLIVGFVWYPIKRMISRRKNATTETKDA